MHHRWRYPNITLLFISLAVTVFLLNNGWLGHLKDGFESIGYLGVFVAGFLFVSTFTIAPAAAILFEFAQNLEPIFVALIGGVGAAIGDYLAYRFIRDRLFAELNPLLKALHLYRRIDILHTKYFAWLAPVIGAAIVASPLPDEIGLSLLGLKKIAFSRFIALAFLLNALGIYVIAIAANSAP
ncbi:MAG: hypothetical protein HZB70_01635 [Candidatus Berkelbacteria bacterium]|nr:MAG: hypothetical protein HZB70_01635 [Candidatus Berkelbacteria bacterium]QQG51967.1 MAG: hypothetical protein HY845_01360 [Candidatus Berkelbacteria bacterium]